jgi:hypothetical protein
MTAKTVPGVLQEYADRGLFRNFHADPKKGEFRFIWMGHKPMRLQWRAGAAIFKDVLPNAPTRGVMYRELREFLKERAAADLPDHRRVDPARLEILCQNRQSQVSVGLRIMGGTEEEAMRKLMLLMHELFLFLNDRWLDYMHEEFGASLE